MQENRNNLERVQKTALKIILKDEYHSYELALKQTNLETLNERRDRLCLNFAKKCMKNVHTKDLFPTNLNHKCNRDRLPTHAKFYHEQYKVTFANTERFRNSPIIYMQHLLNQDHKCKSD